MPPDTNDRRPRAESGDHDDGHDVSIRVADLLALSDERDQWLARLLAAERAAYQRGYDDGRAAACVALAEIEEHYGQIAWWRQWWAKVARIIQAETDPGARLTRVLREIAEDQRFVREARKTRAEKPWRLTTLELCVLRRLRGADSGDAARAVAG